MKAMILAAGRGERMRPLTDSLPKPLLRVGGKPLIVHHLEALARAGITEIVVNLSWLGEHIAAFLGNGRAWGVAIEYSREGPEPLETAGGIRHALPLLGKGPFWLVNGDIYAEFRFEARRLAPGKLAHLVLTPNPPHHPRGDFALDQGQVRVEGKPLLTYTGIALIDPALVSGLPAGRVPLGPLLREAAARGVLTGELFEGTWTDVGTPARLAELDQRLRG